MDPLGVVEEEPVHELLVESGEVEEERVVVVDEFVLNGAVEALDVGIHLRGLRICVIVGDLEVEESFGEVFLELAPVVGQDEGRRVRKDRAPVFEEFFRRLRGVRDCAPCEREPRMDVLARDDVPAETVHEPFDGVEGDDVTRMLCGEIVGLPEDFPALPGEDLAFAGRPKRCDTHAALVFDDAADGGGFGTRKMQWCAELCEERIQFLLTKVGILAPETPYLLHDTPVVPSLLFPLGSAGAAVEALDLSPSLP